MEYAIAFQRLRDVAGRLSRALTKPGNQRQKQPRGHVDTALVNALAEEGCPVCRTRSEHDDRYFFWFLHENYGQVEVIEKLVGSLGFCAAHGVALLARLDEAASQLAFVHEAIARHLIAQSATGTGRKAWGGSLSAGEAAVARCPACRSTEEAVQRCALFLATMLADPDVVGSYANPAILCLPHLQIAVSEVGGALFERLLRLHAGALSTALDAAFCTGHEPDDRPDPSPQRLLQLAVGHDRGPGLYGPAAAGQGPASAMEPAGRTGASIWQLGACPVCLEVRRAWFEWMNWLDAASRSGDCSEDVLPLCADHVWAGVHFGGGALADATARAAAKTALWQIQPALRQIDEPDPRRGSRAWPFRNDGRRHLRMTRARAVVGRPISCPVCRRLEAARDRTLQLLFALLEDRPRRSAFEAGYGLCCKHLLVRSASNPDPSSPSSSPMSSWPSSAAWNGTWGNACVSRHGAPGPRSGTRSSAPPSTPFIAFPGLCSLLPTIGRCTPGAHARRLLARPRMLRRRPERSARDHQGRSPSAEVRSCPDAGANVGPLPRQFTVLHRQP